MTRRQGGTLRSRTAPLVRVPRTLPRILSPAEADRLVAGLRTDRDRAMVLAMLLAGLRRCEVLGLRFADIQVAGTRPAQRTGAPDAPAARLSRRRDWRVPAPVWESGRLSCSDSGQDMSYVPGAAAGG
jgi:integrase